MLFRVVPLQTLVHCTKAASIHGRTRCTHPPTSGSTVRYSGTSTNTGTQRCAPHARPQVVHTPIDPTEGRTALKLVYLGGVATSGGDGRPFSGQAGGGVCWPRHASLTEACIRSCVQPLVRHKQDMVAKEKTRGLCPQVSYADRSYDGPVGEAWLPEKTCFTEPETHFCATRADPNPTQLAPDNRVMRKAQKAPVPTHHASRDLYGRFVVLISGPTS